MSVESIVNRNLLKYSAGNSIFCPLCNEIADFRRWVIATSPSGATQRCCCVSCWNELIKDAFVEQLIDWDIVTLAKGVKGAKIVKSLTTTEQ